jgi:hypothetical protein
MDERTCRGECDLFLPEFNEESRKAGKEEPREALFQSACQQFLPAFLLSSSRNWRCRGLILRSDASFTSGAESKDLRGGGRPGKEAVGVSRASYHPGITRFPGRSSGRMPLPAPSLLPLRVIAAFFSESVALIFSAPSRHRAEVYVYVIARRDEIRGLLWRSKTHKTNLIIGGSRLIAWA